MLCAAALVGAVIAGCGGDDSNPSVSPSPTASLAPATPSPTPSPTASLDFDEDRAMAHDHKLAVDIGIRAAGTEGEKQGADYIREQLASFGYDASEQTFPITVYEGVETALEIESPQPQTIAANPMTYSASGDAEGELIAVPNLGEPGDFPAETSGRIALIERGTLPFSDKVAYAQTAGAIGVIIFNNAPGPFNATLRGPTEVPSVTISQEDGVALRDKAAAGTVRLKVSVRAITSAGQSQNVVAEMPGGGDCLVVIGGHYDSVPAGPGANDNGSGTSVAIELARVLAARGETAGVCFALFGSEEIGLIGSQYYVSQLSEAQRSAMLGLLNFDMLGVGDQWPMAGSESLTSLAVQKAEALGVQAYAGSLPPNVGSDHASFVNAGIPGILFNCFCDPNYHTAADRYEFVVADRLKTAGEIGLAMVEALLGSGTA